MSSPEPPAPRTGDLETNRRIAYVERNSTHRSVWGRYLPLALFGLMLAGVYATGLYRYLSLESLRQNASALTGLVHEHRLAAAVGFVVVYAGSVALSVPGAVALTVAGGFLFGSILGTGLVLLAATLGAIILFFVARSAFGAGLARSVGGTIQKLEAGFRRDAFNYLLFLRLLPIFPFWLVNLAAALLGVNLRTFVIATAIGIVPGSFVYVQLGAGLGDALLVGPLPSLASVFTPKLMIAFAGLALLAVLPVIYKRLKGDPSA